MMSNEIERYLMERNYKLKPDEIKYCIDTEVNPQIDHVLYKDNKYEMWDSSGRNFVFYALN